jgi:dihydropteroate synthase
MYIRPIQFSFNLRGRLFVFDRPQVMGILNLTPDSFYEGSRVNSEQMLIDRAGKMLQDGADLLDLGGQSTRPGSNRIDAEEESDRVIPAVEALCKAFPDCIVSIDTFYALVADRAIAAGASIINDISGGMADPEMFATAGRLHVPYVLTHIQGEPQTMQVNPHYEDVTGEVTRYFSEKIELLKQAGVHDIILDPGFGFGKTAEHNMQLLKNLDQFAMFGMPVMAGLSRKKTIQQLLQTDAAGAKNGTVVAHTIAMCNGASFIRTHDVPEAVESVKLITALRSASS